MESTNTLDERYENQYILLRVVNISTADYCLLKIFITLHFNSNKMKEKGEEILLFFPLKRIADFASYKKKKKN